MSSRPDLHGATRRPAKPVRVHPPSYSPKSKPLAGSMRALIYDSALVPMTSRWYRAVLDRLSPRTRLLDVGIGTGGALAANARALVDKQIHVTGVEIDADYVKQCRTRLVKKGLDSLVQVELESVYDHAGATYDAAYFSASFMLLPDPEAALRHVMSLVVPSGRIYFTQTFQDKRAPLLEKAKPLLVKVTTVDFGKVTYEEDFYRAAGNAGMEILEMETLNKGMGRSSRLVVGRRIGL